MSGIINLDKNDVEEIPLLNDKHLDNNTAPAIARENVSIAPEDDDFASITYHLSTNDGPILHTLEVPVQVLNDMTKESDGETHRHRTLDVGITLPFGDDDKCCRICQEDDHQHDMIAPCRCSGSGKWIHRSCLDKWRTHTFNPSHIFRCPTCKQLYILEKDDSERKAKGRYRLKVGRDIIFFVLLFVGLLLLAEFIVGFINYESFPLESYLPEEWQSGGLRYLFSVLMGIGCFFAFIGLMGIITMCTIGCCTMLIDEPPILRFYWCYLLWPRPPVYYSASRGVATIPATNCSACGNGAECCSVGCSGSGCSGDCCSGDCCSGDCCSGCDDIRVVAIIALIVFIILIVVGVVIVILLAFFIVTAVLQRHIYILEQKEACSLYPVKDLAHISSV